MAISPIHHDRLTIKSEMSAGCRNNEYTIGITDEQPEGNAEQHTKSSLIDHAESFIEHQLNLTACLSERTGEKPGV